MFQSIRHKLRDVQTLARLCTLAEELAQRHGRAKPGSEDFILAALGLQDATASKAFASLGIAEQQFRAALAAQRSDALASVRVTIVTEGVAAKPSTWAGSVSALYETEPSGQALVQRLTQAREMREGRSLLGADVLLAAAQERWTPASRAFQRLGISESRLTEAALQSIHHTLGRQEA